MTKIKLFEEFTNEAEHIEESVQKFTEFQSEGETEAEEEEAVEKPEMEEPEGEIKVVSGDEDIEIELSPEDIEDMESEDEDELEEEKADPLMVTSKDTMRIKDIVRKSNGSPSKAKQLANQMCNAIKDKWKALRRARAADMEKRSDLADIFIKRATELGALGA
jgi:hypothetical protein